jgi:hypothetical protein
MKYTMTVEAWQFAADKPIPVWVVRHWHRLGGAKKLTYRAPNDVLLTAQEGDWIVKFKDGSMVPFTHLEFCSTFSVAPDQNLNRESNGTTFRLQ